MIIKKTYFNLLFIFTFFLSTAVLAQSTGGNLSIGENGVIYVHGEHSFVSGGGLISPGMIETSRTGARGYLIFSKGSSWKGAEAGRFVDGYVQVMDEQPFVFPLGAAQTYRPIASSGAIGTTAAYYQDNPAKVLPKHKVSNIRISDREYWDIVGQQPINLSLSWGKESEIKHLTEGQLKNLTILGFKDGGWFPIASTIQEQIPEQMIVQAESKESTSSFNQGVLTTIEPIIPNNYKLFTLGTIINSEDKIGIVKVFPNPVVNTVYVDLNKAGINKGVIQIISSNGQQLIERKFDEQTERIQQFDTTTYSGGLYKVQVKSKDQEYTERFVVNKI